MVHERARQSEMIRHPHLFADAGLPCSHEQSAHGARVLTNFAS